MEFVRHLEDSERTLKSMGLSYSNRLDNEDIIIMLMRKLLKDNLKRKWADKAGDLIQKSGIVRFDYFVQFLKGVAKRRNNRYGKKLRSEKEVKKYQGNPKSEGTKRIQVYALQSKGNNVSGGNRTCKQCSSPHGIWRCAVFKALSLKDRMRAINQQRLCRLCLGEGHFAKACKSGFTCRVTGCGKPHHQLIHPNSEGESDPAVTENATKKDPARIDQKSPGGQNVPQQSLSSLEANIGATQTGRPRVCFKVVPVKVRSMAGFKELIMHAFLDGSSDTTLCLESLIHNLDIRDAKPMEYTMTANSQQKKAGYEVQLDVESVTGDQSFRLDGVLTTDCLPVNKRHIATNEEVQEWSHLQDITWPETGDKQQVTILIGGDRPDIIDNYLEHRDGQRGQPCAVKTPLGWTVFGPISVPEKGENVSINYVRSEYEVLQRKLEQMYDLEFKDVNEDANDSLSLQDRQAEEMMARTTVLRDGHYQIGLPFKHQKPRFTDSRPMAEARLKCLKSRMQRDENFRKKCISVMCKYQEEGAARVVPDEELSQLGPLWYLLHHAVWHPKKPGEPRVVFDCASKTDGTSLNHELLQGPENMSTLISVMLRFRVENVAVTADIKRMFHQVHVIPEHRGALYFLWWPDGNITKETKTYQMLVHIFGAKSSPSVAGYALRKAAEDNAEDYSPEVIDAVLQDFHVDDLLKSYATPEEAVSISKQLRSLLEKGGFELTKRNSNCREVLEEFPPESRAPVVKDLNLELEDVLPVDHALGVVGTSKETRSCWLLLTRRSLTIGKVFYRR